MNTAFTYDIDVQSLLKVDPCDTVQMYNVCRSICLYQSQFKPEGMCRLYRALIALEIPHTYNDLIEIAAESPVGASAEFDALRNAFSAIQSADIPKHLFDIWEGHAMPPVPNAKRRNSKAETLACLADELDFRPFLADYRINDPGEAKGTLIVVPSVRGSHTELTEVAAIFNGMGYNVFCLEPRFDRVGDMVYALLELDAQRAIRYVRYHAPALGIDPDRIICLGGSKGNFIHHMTYDAFDLDPKAYIRSLGSALNDYACDVIDTVPSNCAAMVVSYGSLIITYDRQKNLSERFTPEFITRSRIYTRENAQKGLRFPAVMVLAGTADELDMPTVGSMCDGLHQYNRMEDRLYDIPYELHVMNGVRHAFAAGSSYKNVPTIWRSVDLFLESVQPLKVRNLSETER